MQNGMMYVSLSFVSVLQDVLGGVFDTVLAPVLRDVANILINTAGALIQDILSGVLLKIWVVLLKLIAFLEAIFNVFSGISPVKVTGVSRKLTLLEYFFRLPEIQRAFLVITAVAVFTAFITTLIAVGKSISDMTFENKSPISTVLKQGIKAVVTFMIIPVCCLFMLHMVTQITVIMHSTMAGQTANTSMSDVMFISVAQDAAKNNAAKTAFASDQKYENVDEVEKNFDIKKFNYVLAYASTALVALLMLCSILQFIQRIFMILLLYLVSPFFVAYMPLDGGNKFREWREMFVAQMISAFGPIICMKLYFMVVPYLVGSSIQYGDFNGYTQTCMKLFIVIGGAFAVYKSRLLLISIVNPAAAGAMAESGIIGSFISGKIMGAASRAGRARPAGSGGQKQYQSQSQAFTGK